MIVAFANCKIFDRRSIHKILLDAGYPGIRDKPEDQLRLEIDLCKETQPGIVSFLDACADGFLPLAWVSRGVEAFFQGISGTKIKETSTKILKANQPWDVRIFYQRTSMTLPQAVLQEIGKMAIDGTLDDLKKIRRCQHCQKFFLPTRVDARFCSDSHRARYNFLNKNK
jgi:hypothetical protein